MEKYGSQTRHRWQYGACVLHAVYLRLQTHTHNIYIYSLLFHCNNGCTNAPPKHIIRTLPVLSKLFLWSPYHKWGYALSDTLICAQLLNRFSAFNGTGISLKMWQTVWHCILTSVWIWPTVTRLTTLKCILIFPSLLLIGRHGLCRLAMAFEPQ
jgi:hypothetical protein